MSFALVTTPTNLVAKIYRAKTFCYTVSPTIVITGGLGVMFLFVLFSGLPFVQTSCGGSQQPNVCHAYDRTIIALRKASVSLQ